jgi:hypothetical protein
MEVLLQELFSGQAAVSKAARGVMDDNVVQKVRTVRTVRGALA